MSERHQKRLTNFALPLGLVVGVGVGRELMARGVSTPGGPLALAAVIAIAATLGARLFLGWAWLPAESPAEKRRASLRGALALGLIGSFMMVGGAIALVLKKPADTVERDGAGAKVAELHFANLLQCAFGERPTSHGEVDRLTRRIGAAGKRAAQSLAGCTVHAIDLHRALTANAAYPELRAALEQHLKCPACTLADRRALTGVILAAQGVTIANPTVPGPPRVNGPWFTQDAFKPVLMSRQPVQERAVHARPQVDLLVPARRGFALCRFSMVGMASLRCEPLSPAEDAKPHLVDPRHADLLSSAARVALVGDRVQYWRHQKAVDAVAGVEDGAVVVPTDEGWRLTRVKDGAPTSSHEATVGRVPLIVGRSVLALESRDTETQLLTFALADDGLGEPRTVGAVSAGARWRGRCAHDQSAAVWAGDGQTEAVMMVGPESQVIVDRYESLDARSTSPPPPRAAPVPSSAPHAKALEAAADFGVAGLEPEPASSGGFEAAAPAPRELYPTARRGRGPGGVVWASPRPHLPRTQRTCFSTDAGFVALATAWSWAADEPVVVQARCDTGGCERRRSAPLPIDVRSSWAAATLKSGDVLAVWQGTDGITRMRQGPLETLHEAPDEALMDSREHGGPEVKDLEAFASGDTLVFWFRNGRGHYGLQVDTVGHRQPLELAVDR